MYCWTSRRHFEKLRFPYINSLRVKHLEFAGEIVNTCLTLHNIAIASEGNIVNLPNLELELVDEQFRNFDDYFDNVV